MTVKVFLADLAHDYLRTNFPVPLGIGFIGEYIKSRFPGELDVKLFKSTGHLLEELRSGPAPQVIGMSNYSWNEGLNELVERRLGAEFPQTIVVQGGPHIRTDEKGIAEYLRVRPSVDYYTMFEGEWPMAFLLEHFFSEGRFVKPGEMTATIPGVAYLQDDELVYESYSSPKDALNLIPSPYLSGAMDEFLHDAYYQPMIETNRGCPFACTFCAWGIAALNKVRRFDTDRILEEIRYVGRKSTSPYWQFTDANFGMYERDLDIAREMKNVADKYALQRVSVNWAKNSSKYCTEIAHILKDIADPLAAVQSTDPEVLMHVKRSNIGMATMTDLVEQGRKDGIPYTTDVLACLPGESLESHLNTLRDVFQMGFTFFNVGQIRMLPGSEMENEETRKAYELKTKFRLISGQYGQYDGEPVIEYEESIIGSSTMSREHMATIRVIHFLVWMFWNSGLAQPLLRWLFEAKGINPLDAILPVQELGNSAEVDGFLGNYKSEIGREWFDSKEELLGHFKSHFGDLIAEDYVKTNHKYLAQVLLNKAFARELLTIIADKAVGASDPDAMELVDFCIERMFFLESKCQEKVVEVSPQLATNLQGIFPSLGDGEGTECRFFISEKLMRSFEMELEKFEFDKAPIRAMALFLQLYGADMVYSFELSGSTAVRDAAKASDSFDYDRKTQQFGTAAE